MVFGDIDCRHCPDQNIVQRYRNRGSDLVAAENPRYANRQQRLQRIQRGESEENSDRGPQSNRVRRVGDRHQRHVMRDQPALHPRQRLRQTRFVNGLAGWCVSVVSTSINLAENANTQRRTPNIELQNRAPQCELQCCACWFVRR